MIGDLRIKQIENSIKFTDYDFRDMFGTKIHIGDVVCFCENWGQVDSTLNCAIILDIVDEKIDNYNKIKFHLILFPIPSKKVIVNKFVSNVKFYKS